MLALTVIGQRGPILTAIRGSSERKCLIRALLVLTEHRLWQMLQSEEEMSEPEKNPQTELTNLAKIGAVVKNYKELIASIVFFVGGITSSIIWLFAYFATKEEVKTLDCLLQNHVQFLRGSQDQKTYDTDLIDTDVQIERLKRHPKGAQILPDEINRIAQLERRKEDIM
jgi:hypothetical protein